MASEINIIFVFCDATTKWFMSTSSEKKSLYHLKCCSRWCIKFNGHSSLRWWMKRKVEEDMVNVAPNPCVLFYFISPQISRDKCVHSLWLIFEVTEPLNKYQQLLCCIFRLVSVPYINLLLIFGTFSCCSYDFFAKNSYTTIIICALLSYLAKSHSLPCSVQIDKLP